MVGGLRLWLSLQIQSRMRSGLLELNVPGVEGTLRVRKTDLPIFWQILVMREYLFEALPQNQRVRDAYRAILARGKKPVIVDCGGHIGFSAIWFASHYPEATVYVIEPNSANFSLLQQNAQAYKNIVPLNGGVWKRSCRLVIANPDAGSASFQLQEIADLAGVEGDQSLRAYTIDELSHREPENQLFLVKIDIEGAEAKIFEDQADWLEAATLVIIELHDWLMPGQGTSKNLFKRLGENNFDVVIRGENLLLFQVSAGQLTHV